jgi:hypothetical protein
VTAQIELKSEASRLVISVRDYEDRSTRLASGDNWLQCDFSLHVGPFDGTYGGNLTTDEIESLLRDLETVVETLAGTVAFKPIEAGLELEIQMGTHGDVTVRGKASPIDHPKVALSFAFDTDQTFLRMTLADARRAAMAFPRLT